MPTIPTGPPSARRRNRTDSMSRSTSASSNVWPRRSSWGTNTTRLAPASDRATRTRRGSSLPCGAAPGESTMAGARPGEYRSPTSPGAGRTVRTEIRRAKGRGSASPTERARTGTAFARARSHGTVPTTRTAMAAPTPAATRTRRVRLSRRGTSPGGPASPACVRCLP